MDIFDLSISEFKQEMNKIVNSQTKEELLEELVKCGLKLENHERKSEK